MRSRPILKYPNDKLRKISDAISVDEIPNRKTQTLIDDLIQTLYVESGVGLAAPQIGVNKRIIVVDVGDGARVFINPKILSASIRKIKSQEGCLSIPGVNGIVRRHRGLIMTALSCEGKTMRVHATGLLAIVIQHETDHLDGVLFIDKAISFTNPPKL